jgi:transaldolase
MKNPLLRLLDLGQSIWLDFIERTLLTSGRLQRLISDDGLRGMTSNPTIFAKAISAGNHYDEDIRRAASQADQAARSVGRVVEAVMVEDVRRAADIFRPVYDSTEGADGFVSIEVRPALAHDTSGTIEEARRLWQACDRPNVMVKIPGTRAGLPAIERCLAEGININITLLFSVTRHREVMNAYLGALEQRAAAGQPLDRIASVASFFVSRVDTNVDKKLDAIVKSAAPDDQKRRATALRSKLAIANARLAYEAFEEVRRGPRFTAVAAKGARGQRPLWASTSTKDPSLPDVYYVEALIGPDTVDTLPPETVDAYRDHGDPKVRINDDLAGAHAAMHELAALDIHFDAVAQELEDEGVKKFSDSYNELSQTIAEKLKSLLAA